MQPPFFYFNFADQVNAKENKDHDEQNPSPLESTLRPKYGINLANVWA